MAPPNSFINFLLEFFLTHYHIRSILHTDCNELCRALQRATRDRGTQKMTKERREEEIFSLLKTSFSLTL